MEEPLVTDPGECPGLVGVGFVTARLEPEVVDLPLPLIPPLLLLELPPSLA